MQKSFNAKNFWKCIFRASRRVSFSDFPKTALDHVECPMIPFTIFEDYVTIFNSNPKQHLKALWDKKKDNDWKLLLIITYRLVLNVAAGFQEPTLKCINKCRYWDIEVFHPPFACSKSAKFERIYVGWVWKAVVSDNKFLFSNYKKYIALSFWENLVGYMLSSLFTQHTVAERIKFHDSTSKR